MNDANHAQQLTNHRWWSERIDALLSGLRGRIEQADAETDAESPFPYYDALRNQSEFPLLVDSIASLLSKEQIPITNAESEILRELMYRVESPPSFFRCLNDRETVMASLNVTEIP
ncbi:hypothetical protein [Nocardia acidivorans]|uniref:hypothetical protein n=1 Tax=Nocardia acidivorans TaxID=404580 RepID=UPI00083733DC|nr:hypothetical protein [Nocardia acidivorans]